MACAGDADSAISSAATDSPRNIFLGESHGWDRIEVMVDMS